MHCAGPYIGHQCRLLNYDHNPASAALFPVYKANCWLQSVIPTTLEYISKLFPYNLINYTILLLVRGLLKRKK